jgi:single-stranded-DNA-specific exonuclease
MAEGKTWQILDEITVPDAFQAAIGGHALVAQTLYHQGYQTLEAAQAFLNPDLYQPASPYELPDMDIACDLLARAVRARDHILVWGDFDVDGQTATAVLVEGLRNVGAQVSYHIPVRAKESHGIRQQVLKTYISKGFDLLLTCDTGISEHDSLQIVRNLSIPAIVTDHHQLGDRLPPANAVINPQRLAKGHPLRTLPGVGVAYQLIAGLYDHLGYTADLAHLLELVALGIVADVAELRGDTRYLLQKGLRNLRETRRVGLNLLYERAELNPTHLNETHIGFQLAPRLNAVGRLGDANPMVDFLTSEDVGQARQLANLIEGLNLKRRTETRHVERGAESLLDGSSADRHASAIVLHQPSWPGGVVGIVASRLVERYQKPVILLTGDDPVHGSARSLPGLDITAAIAAQADLLTGYGGHPMAAGLSLPAQHYTAFKRRFLATVAARLREVKVDKALQVAGEITIDQIDLALVEEINRLAPFGNGNPPLLFLLRDVQFVSDSQVGAEREHRQVVVKDNAEKELRLIWWNGGDEPLPEAQFDLVCQLSQSDYKGTRQVSAEWVDFRLSEAGRLEIEARQVEIIDYRAINDPLGQLAACLAADPAAVVWGEGDLPGELPFKGRHELGVSLHVILWTAPPSPPVLRLVLQRTQAKRVTVFAMNPGFDALEEFLPRLGSAAHYAINNLNGTASLERLAAACAAEEESVRLGLSLWQARGELTIEFSNAEARIRRGARIPDQEAIESYQGMLKGLLAESRAYRRRFYSGDLAHIINR